MDMISLRGQRFGRCLVLGFSHKDTRRRMHWLCECESGKEKPVSSTNLKQGISKSCGCLARELKRTRLVKHGMGGTKEYISWQRMLARCTDPKDANYRYYGGRSITVYDQWRHGGGDKTGFECRLEYILANLGPRPSPEHTIDRIDNNGNYEPGNIKWSTKKEGGDVADCNERCSTKPPSIPKKRTMRAGRTNAASSRPAFWRTC